MPKLLDLVSAQVEARRDKPAFASDAGDGFTEVTYGAFWAQARAVAAELHRLGAKAGDRVALAAHNSPQWCAGYIGIHIAGMTVAPLDAGYTEREVRRVCDFLQPAAAVCDADHARLLPPKLERRIDADRLAFDADADFAPVPLAAGQPLSIIFTSGTTAQPKGVMLSESNILSNVTAVLANRFMRERAERVLLMLPLHHVYACTVTFLAPLCCGATLVFPRSLRGEDLGAAIREQGVTIFPTVPQVLGLFRKKIYSTIRSAPWHKRAAFNALAALNRGLRFVGVNANRVLLRSVHKSFPRVRYLACGGARLEPEVFDDLHRLGFTIVEAYGLTETSPLVTMNTPRQQTAGSVGRPIPGVEVRIDRSDPALQAGEVCVRGPNVMMGYYRDPEATAKAVQDGWFHTGDLGYLDKRGRLFLTGRAKEVIVLPSGKNIYPEELEKHYAEPEPVEEACVLSLPGKDGGQENLTAAVYPNMAYFRQHKSGSVAQEVKYVVENVAMTLPSYARVTRVELVDEPFPRTRLGKLMRYQIRDALLGRQAGVARQSAAPQPEETDDPLLLFVMEQLELAAPPGAKSNIETDLGVDSLSKLELLAAFEKRFGVRISEGDAAEVMTVADLRRFMSAAPDSQAESVASLRAEPDAPLSEHVDTGSGLCAESARLGAYGLMRLVLRGLFRLEVSGLEHLPRSGAFIVAPNHASYFDPVVAFGGMPWAVSRRTFSLSLPDVFGRLPLSLIRRPARVILTGTQDTTARSMQYCAQVLASGQPMCIFPEGKRSADGRVDAPKRGVGMLSHEFAAPMLPVYIDGANELLSRSNPGVRLTDIRVEIFPPIDPAQPPERILAEWLEVMRARDRRAARSP